MTTSLHPKFCLIPARIIASLTLLLAIMAVLGAASAPASAATTCDRVASPSGSDGNSGTVTSPFRSVQKLVNSLSSGDTGCLRTGTYGSGEETNFSARGTTITTYPGDKQATVAGFPYVSGAGETLSYLNFSLNKTGDSWPALCQGAISGGAHVTYGFDIEANNVTVEHSNVYVDPSIPMKARGDGMGVGWSNHTSGDVIRNNRIHDVGFCPVEEHGIYLNKTSGIQVYGNWIYNIPAGTGIQLWDGPTDAHIYSNVIDNTSSCVDVGGNTPVTAGNLIEHNICSNMAGVQQPYKAYCASPGPGCTGPDHGRPLFDYWATGPGSGNVMQNNLTYCASTAHCSTSFAGASGVATRGNAAANPQFADSNYQTSHDYRVASSSPGASWGLWNGGSATGSPSSASFRARARIAQRSHRGAGHHARRSHKAAGHHARRSHKAASHRPDIPTRLRATGGNGRITVSWVANAAGERVTHYDVYRTDQTFTGAWATPTATKFTNSSNVVKGRKYCYQLSATNKIGKSAKSAPVCVQL